MTWWWSLVPLAGAQTPEADPALEPARVLVTTLQALDERPEGDVAALYEALARAFADHHRLVGLEEVPPFRVHGYGPELYMQSCPPGKYSGCALVLGQRVGAPWAVGGTLERREDGFDGSEFDVLEVVLVDVERSVELARVSLTLPKPGETEPSRQVPALMAGIVQLFDDLRPTVSEVRDLRDTDDFGQDAATRARIAEALRAIEEELGTAVSAEVTVREPERVTRASLEAYRNREGPTPWDRLDMRESEWVRYQNSGDDLETWRRAQRGRIGQVVVRLTAGPSRGPWHQNVEGVLLRSSFDLEPVHTVQYVEAVRGSTAVGALEVGFGVWRGLDLSFVVSRRSARASVVREDITQGRPDVPDDPAITTWGLTQIGGRATLAPFWLHAPARPLLVVGLTGWRGRAVPEEDAFPRLDAPRLTVAEVLVGGEVDTSPSFGLTVRGGIDVPLGGRWVAFTNEGAGIEDPPVPSGLQPLGWTVQLGFQVRISAIGGPS